MDHASDAKCETNLVSATKALSLPKIIYRPNEIVALRESISASSKKKRIAFVPFLGGLHAGHVALVKAAKELADEVWCSLFLNRLQFQSKEDYDTYPMIEVEDIRILTENGADVIFKPSMEDMYVTKNHCFPARVDFDGIEDVDGEGKKRPKFFKGVGTAVCKLFAWIRPHYAVFGQKDFQQCVLVRRLADEFFPTTQIVVHPVVRDADSLACSTRNARLSSDDRCAALHVYKLLCSVKEAFDQNELNVQKLLSTGKNFAQENNMSLDYITINNWFSGEQLLEDSSLYKGGKYCVCVAVTANPNCRLLDNIVLETGGDEAEEMENDKRDEVKCLQSSSISASHRLLFDTLGFRLGHVQKADVQDVAQVVARCFSSGEDISVALLRQMFENAGTFFIGLYKRRYMDNDDISANNSAKLFGLVSATHSSSKGIPSTAACNHEPDGECLRIDHVAIEPNYQRRGYGEILVKQYCKYVAALGSNVKKISLSSPHHLVHFFERCGFQVIGQQLHIPGQPLSHEMEMILDEKVAQKDTHE